MSYMSWYIPLSQKKKKKKKYVIFDSYSNAVPDVGWNEILK